MTKQQLENLYLQTDSGLFTPIYSFTESIPIYDEEGEIIDYELIDYVETISAKEYYQEWLENKDKQIDICPEKTTEEKVEDLINQVTVMDEIIASLTLEVL